MQRRLDRPARKHRLLLDAPEAPAQGELDAPWDQRANGVVASSSRGLRRPTESAGCDLEIGLAPERPHELVGVEREEDAAIVGPPDPSHLRARLIDDRGLRLPIAIGGNERVVAESAEDRKRPDPVRAAATPLRRPDERGPLLETNPLEPVVGRLDRVRHSEVLEQRHRPRREQPAHQAA